MAKLFRIYTIPLLASVIATTLVAVIFQTQRVIAKLENIGGEVSLTTQISMSFYDIHHLGSLYLVFIFVAFMVAMSVAGFIVRKTSVSGSLLYMAAGAAAMIVMLLLMKQVFFDVQIIAGARDMLGLMLQMVAGAIGGWVFSYVHQRLSKPTNS